MGKAYEIGPITQRQVDGAYLLARLFAPSLDLDAWRERCARGWRLDADEIVVASNQLGYVQGLAVCGVDPSRPGGAMLDVSSFVVVSAADQPGVGRELARYLVRRADQAGCRTIRIRLADGAEHMLSVDADPAEIEALLLAVPGVPR